MNEENKEEGFYYLGFFAFLLKALCQREVKGGQGRQPASIKLKVFATRFLLSFTIAPPSPLSFSFDTHSLADRIASLVKLQAWMRTICVFLVKDP